MSQICPAPSRHADRPFSQTLPSLVILSVSLMLGACSSIDHATRKAADVVTFYKPEVVQGNFVSREQVETLHQGMTRLQVRDVLGTPLMSSLFHQDRWDYVFTIKRRGVKNQQYHLTLFFDGDSLDRFEGDNMPSEAEFVDDIGSKRKFKTPKLEATPEQLERFPGPSAPDVTPTLTLPAEPGSYPPLESGR